MMWSEEKMFSIRSSKVIIGCEPPAVTPSEAITNPFTEEGTIDAACSTKTISVYRSLDRKIDEGIRSGDRRRIYSVVPILHKSKG